MKIIMNGKRLKNDINVSLIRGKYNRGLSNENSSLGSEIRITAKEKSLIIENGDVSTYIRVENYHMECETPGFNTHRLRRDRRL